MRESRICLATGVKLAVVILLTMGLALLARAQAVLYVASGNGNYS